MKNLLLLISLTFLTSTLTALPVGNPAEPYLLGKGIFFDCAKTFNVRAGFYGDYVYNRRLKVDSSSAQDRHIEETIIVTNAAYFGVTFCDRVEGFATIGSTDAKILTNFVAFSPGPGFTDALPRGHQLEVKTKTGLSWSTGLKGILWQCGPIFIGAEAQYFHSDPRLNFILLEDNVSNYTENVRVRMREWQVGLGVTYRLNPIIAPYAAVKWSHLRVRSGEPRLGFTGRGPTEFIVLNDLKNSRTWGYVVGASAAILGRILCTAEVRFAGEKALFVNGQIRF